MKEPTQQRKRFPAEQNEQHLPGPFRAEKPPCSNGYVHVYGVGSEIELCTCYRPDNGEADAAFIVRACNAHEELLAALEASLRFIDAVLPTIDHNREAQAVRTAIQARAAIAKATQP